MDSQEIRRNFIKYFKNQNHRSLPSSPVVPHNDPTLLFTNAGMNQFKEIFLGQEKTTTKRVVTSQKCIRVGGKHNDLENVGHTTRHLTFFEMLGNFSFGDYFKEEAIKFAWEVTLNVFKFDLERIWITVFRDDDEAFEIWKKYVDEKKIVRMDEKDNFWAMGDIGPCGPCSELFYDKGDTYGNATSPLNDKDGERFFEFWNLVFMQFNRDTSGRLNPLPNQCVDTGAGLERVVSLKIDAKNVFETDILRALISRIESIFRVSYDAKNDNKAAAFHVIADHLRTLCFSIADGVIPSNVDRGYVLRKVLRRAVRYGKLLGREKPFLGEVFPTLVELMGEDYIELKKGAGRIAEILTLEEEAFFKTLKRGGNLLNQVIDAAKKSSNKVISGEDAFKLKDTYGLPLEEVILVAKDSHLSLDLNTYERLEKEAKEKSRKAHKEAHQIASQSLFEAFLDEHGKTEFLGYKDNLSNSKVIALVKDQEFVNGLSEGEEGLVILDKTPFYAEMGGQVGDSGSIRTGNGLDIEIHDCLSPFTGIVAHVCTVKKGHLNKGDHIDVKINIDRRALIANNHTATHLLHFALQKVLGEHIQQKGSLVDEKRLRFDFSHHKSLSNNQIDQIEAMVNEKIRLNKKVDCYEISYQDVQNREDIKQFFGDKYGDFVRVVDIDFSKELCGGTHTTQIGNIGYFRISKESSIAAGIRRIEAVTGKEAEKFVKKEEELIDEASLLVKTTPQKLLDRLKSLIEENLSLKNQAKEFKKESSKLVLGSLLDKKVNIKNMVYLGSIVDVDPKELKDFSLMLQDNMEMSVIILGVVIEERCQLMIRVSKELIKRGIKAKELIEILAPIIGGRGGGKDDIAQAGGSNPKSLPDLFEKAKEVLMKYS